MLTLAAASAAAAQPSLDVPLPPLPCTPARHVTASASPSAVAAAADLAVLRRSESPVPLLVLVPASEKVLSPVLGA